MLPNEQVEDRAKVQTHLGVNMVVEAGAGTGKTTLLITRIGLAVLAQGTPVEKIVALTFTEKAAAEIKNRLVTLLHQIVQTLKHPGDSPRAAVSPSAQLLELLQEQFSLSKEVILSRAQTALARLDRASVGTIHSFCADILKTFPLEAGLAPNSEIDAGYKAAHLFNLHWNTFLDRELGVQAPRRHLWKAVLPEISLQELQLFAQELCSGKIGKYDYFSHAQMLARVCEEKSKQALSWSGAFLDPQKPKPRNIEKALTWAAESLLRSAAFLRCQPLPPKPTLEAPSLTSTLPKGWDEESFEEARALVQFAFKVCPEQQEIFRMALELVQEVSAQIRAQYAREGILSFDDLIVKTRDLVQQDLYVRRLLKEKFDILFIDEFQDTDPVQGELLLFLAEEKSTSASRWQDVRLQPGKLFVVGDPKQSVYRFRGADITAYELFTRLILDQHGEKCFLRRNFRSTPDIVAVANAVCSRAMIQQTAFQPAYEPIFPVKARQPESVRWLFIQEPPDKAGADDFRANQAERIAEWIENNVGKLVLASGEKLAYKDIAILSRASTTTGPYLDALRRHGIAFNADSEKNFYRRQEINDFLNFLRLVCDPSDQTALVGFLRSPLGGMSDEEIYQLAAKGELGLKEPLASPALAQAARLVHSFSRQVGRTSVKKLLEEILDNTFLPEACACAYEREKTLAVLRQLVMLAQGAAGQAPVSLGQFLSSVQEMLENDPQQLGAVQADEADAVNVMTVHKSKGLDFPVVILADLSRKETASSATPVRHIFSWQYNMHGLRAGRICDVNLAFLEEEQKKHERCEEVRILYVALTRAKEKMLLVADARKGAANAAAGFVSAGLFPQGPCERLGTDEVQIPVDSFAYDKPEHFLYRQRPLRTNYLPPQDLQDWRAAYDARKERYDKLLSERVLSPSQRAEEGVSLSPRQMEGAQTGTVCHRALQILLSSAPVSVQEAVRQAVQDTHLPAQLEPAVEIVVPFAKSDLFALLKQSELLASEMPFTFVTPGGQVESGVMDAVLRQPDGTIWIVDYKTDYIPPQGPQAVVEKYRPQLAVYQAAARQLFAGEKVRCSAVLLRAFAAYDL